MVGASCVVPMANRWPSDEVARVSAGDSGGFRRTRITRSVITYWVKRWISQATRRDLADGIRQQGMRAIPWFRHAFMTPIQGETVNASSAHTLIAPVIPPHPSSPYDNWLAAFPLRTFLELGAYNTAPGSARGHARNVLREWRLDDLEDAVLLVVSELVTNAVAATGRGLWEAELPPVRLWLLGSAGADGTGKVMVLVWDAVAEPPVRVEATDEDESGRGLEIVDCLSARHWDCYLPSAPHAGKVTRALISTP
jgi:hypothetical protein